MRSKYFVIPNNKKYKKVSEVNFLFPLKGFNVGKPCLFTIDELPIDSYIYINRLLDEEGLTKLDSILANNINKIKGVFFEDLGVLELIKEKKYPFETIYYPSHALCSEATCQRFLKECNYVVLSSDIKYEDIAKFHDLSHIGSVIFTKLPFMYSRRSLVSNYQKVHDLDITSKLVVSNKSSQDELVFDENEYGTLVYDSTFYDGRELLDLNMSFYIIDFSYLDIVDYEEWFNNYILKRGIIDGTTGFLHREMIVKLPPKEAKR